MVGLLDVPALRPAVLEGLVASIGGLDGSLSAATTSALVHWLAAGGPGLHLKQPYLCRTLKGPCSVQEDLALEPAACLWVQPRCSASSATVTLQTSQPRLLEERRQTLPCACNREATDHG